MDTTHSSRAALTTALLATFPAIARADGLANGEEIGWHTWNGDALTLLSLAMLAWLYTRGLRRVWNRVGQTHKVRPWQAASFYGALLIILIALVSPIDALSDQLSSAHMVQHMLLVSLAAPLLVLGSPMYTIAWGVNEFRRGWGSSVYTFLFRVPQEVVLWHPALVWVIFAVTLWGWHHPVLYQAALRDRLVHDAQHLSFFLSACLFWRLCLDPLAGRRISAVAAVPYLFTTSLHASVLGIFLALSPNVWYADFRETIAFGLSPLQDQQLAGLIMWMPACLFYPAIAAALMGRWLCVQGSRHAPRAVSRFRTNAADGTRSVPATLADDLRSVPATFRHNEPSSM